MRSAILLLACAFAIAADAAPVQWVNRVKVVLQCASLPSLPASVTLIFNGSEHDTLVATRDGAHYVADLVPHRNGLELTASLRFAGGRTGCVRARPIDDVAVFTAGCLREPTWSLRVQPDPVQDVNYLRFLPSVVHPPPATIGCEERGVLKSGDIGAIAPASEFVFLRVGALPAGTSSRTHHISIKGGRYGGHAIGEKPRPFTRQNVIDEFVIERGRANAAAMKDLFEQSLPKNFTGITLGTGR